MKKQTWMNATWFLTVFLLATPGALQAAGTPVAHDIDRETMDKWSAP
jgi:hypothetical protein